ncbi:MAG: substrate-binding domain-containing protein [Alphaproteobacteria bacterium]
MKITTKRVGLVTAGIIAFGALSSYAQCNLSYGVGSSSDDRLPYRELTPKLGELAKQDGVKVGVVLKTLANQYWAEVKRGAEAAGDAFGAQVDVQAADSEASENQQLTIAQVMVNQCYDAYVISPQNSSNLMPAIKQISESCKPLVDVIEPGVIAATYIGADEVYVGRQAAEYLKKELGEGGKVIHIKGAPGSEAGANRTKGFTEGSKELGLDLIATVPADWDQTKAYNATQQLLKRFPDVQGFYAANDTMAVGVAEAVAAAGKSDAIRVIGTDAIPAAVDLIRKGQMTATNTPFPFYQGCKAVEIALRQLSGQKVAAWVDSSPTMIDASNVDAMFAKDGLAVNTGSCEPPSAN